MRLRQPLLNLARVTVPSITANLIARKAFGTKDFRLNKPAMDKTDGYSMFPLQTAFLLVPRLSIAIKL